MLGLALEREKGILWNGAGLAQEPYRLAEWVGIASGALAEFKAARLQNDKQKAQK